MFFNRENYLFFLGKIKNNILPYADILAWCLMPNHFHLMINVNQIEFLIGEQKSEGLASEQVTQSHLLTKMRSLNDSVSIMLRSYTRAIQKQENIAGSLFQNRTKAICLTEPKGVSPTYFQSQFGTMGNISFPEDEYPNACFNYIHFNPVNANLVKHPEDWEFSSYRDYYCGRNGKLINRKLAKELGLNE